MQVIFIQQIKTALTEIKNLQTFITSHSSHIVKNCDFKDIQYFQHDSKNININININIKGFYKDLEQKYGTDIESFKFINQYLTISSAELFFAEKVIFIEGVTERFLLPYFIQRFDNEKGFYVGSKSAEQENIEFKELSSQNISIIEVGANAKAFEHFLNFLGIKALIITDIDTVKQKISEEKGKENTTYPSSSVNEGTHTSNATIKHFYEAPEYKSDDWAEWFDKLKKNQHHQDNSIIKIAFQLEESSYHGRSFEEAFFNININNIDNNKENLQGLKNIKQITLQNADLNIDELIKNVLEQKSTFASSLLWLALTSDVKWNIPSYIKEGLQWIAKP